MIRKLFPLALFIAALAPACSAETVGRPPPPPVNWHAVQTRNMDAGPAVATERERAAAGAYAKALVSPHFTQLGPALDEDAHFAFAGMKDAHGRDKVIEAHETLLGAFDQRAFVVTRIWLTDSTQAIAWTMTGVQARAWVGVPATQKPVTIEGFTLLWTNDDGSITDIHVNFDEAVVKVQLGAGPKELAGLRPPPPPPAAPPGEFERARTEEESANVQRVRDTLGVLEKGDEAAYVEGMTDDFEVTTPERAQPARGKEEARAYLKALRKSIAELDISVENAWGIRQFVVVEYSIVGEQRAPLGWVPLERDRLLKLSVIEVIEMRNGKIARIRRYDNPAQILTSP